MANFIFIATENGLRIVGQESGAWHEASYTLAARRLTSVSVQGSTLLAGTTDGVFCSDDLGQTWRPPSVGITETHVRWVAYHPESPGLAFVGTEPAAIFRTADNAKTWKECPEVARLRDAYEWYLPYSPRAGCVRGFASQGDRIYAAVEQGGLLRSDNRGETWSLAKGSSGKPQEPLPDGFVHNDVHSVVVHPSSPDLVIAATGGGLYRSDDGGGSWMQLYDCYCRAVWVDPNDAHHMILGPADGVDRKGRIEVTVDGGASWQPANEGLDTPWPRHMVEQLAPLKGRLLAVLSNGRIVVASTTELAWQPMVPEIDGVLAVTVM